MTMPHVLDQLPLWVEGDLDAQGMAAVEAHLTLCAACRAEAEAYRESQAWLREEAAPFTAADRETLRHAVFARIPPRRRGSVGTVWIAGLAAAALAFAFLRPRPSPRPAQEASVLPRAPRAAPSARPPLPAPLSRVARRRPLEPVLAPAVGAGPGPARIEIQTQNPQIRIIWLAQANADEGSLPPNPEAP